MIVQYGGKFETEAPLSLVVSPSMALILLIDVQIIINAVMTDHSNGSKNVLEETKRSRKTLRSVNQQVQIAGGIVSLLSTVCILALFLWTDFSLLTW